MPPEKFRGVEIKVTLDPMDINILRTAHGYNTLNEAVAAAGERLAQVMIEADPVQLVDTASFDVTFRMGMGPGGYEDPEEVTEDRPQDLPVEGRTTRFRLLIEDFDG